MRPRHPLPRRWLMTDERQGEGVIAAIERLPPGAGIVFRHYSLPHDERRSLFDRVRQSAEERGLTLVVAGAPVGKGHGAHNRACTGLRTASAHNLREIRRAERRGANLIFLSPVFATRSHAGARPLCPRRFAGLAGQTSLPVIALGGMDEARFRRLRGAYGWAGIDAWSA
jgi:thiamine-phosphate pyrophosphorylase